MSQIAEPIDYEGFREKAMKHIVDFSSDSWTDYNTHDPGVTIMEILCFALTELGLRTNLPMNDLIAELLNKKQAGFYPSHEILTNKPLTKNDYRKLLIDIEGVSNAWLTEIEDHHSPIYVDATNEKLSLLSSVESDYYYDCDHWDHEIGQATEEQKEKLKNYLDRRFTHKKVLLTRIDFRAIFTRYNFLLALELFSGEQILRVERNNDKLKFVFDPTVDAFYVGKMPAGCDSDPPGGPTGQEKRRLQKLVNDLQNNPLNLIEDDFYGIFSAHRSLKSLTFTFDSPAGQGDSTIKDYLKISRDVNGALCFASHDDEDQVGCRGYYRVDVELEEDFPKEKERLKRKLADIRSTLNQNRNLCELFPVVNIVKDEYVCVCFDIELSPDADVEEVMSNVVYRIDRFISPDVHFYSLKQMKEKKYRDQDRNHVVEEIFNGPLLRNGFIEDKELEAAALRSELHASDIVQEIMDVDKVVAVNRLIMSSFHPDEEGNLIPENENENWILTLDPDRATKLLIHHVSGQKEYRSEFTAHKGNLPFSVPPQDLLANIKVLKAQDLPVPFAIEDLTEATPAGEQFDVASYYSIRNHFPMNYALKDGELEGSAANDRKAKVMQLRAFLLLFDQVLANAFCQLSKVGHLLSFGEIDQTYFVQLTEEKEAIGNLLLTSPQEYLEEVRQNTESKYLFDRRRNRFLNHLLSRFAEEFKDYYALAEHIYGDEANQRLIKDKERILNYVVPWSSQRACAENIMISETTPMNLSGLEYKLRVFLGSAARELRKCAYTIVPEQGERILRFFHEETVYLEGTTSELNENELREIAEEVMQDATPSAFKIEEIIEDGASKGWIYRTKKTYAGGFCLRSQGKFDSKDRAEEKLADCLEFFIINANYVRTVNQSNLSLWERSDSNGCPVYGFSVSNRQGKFLTSDEFMNEEARDKAIKDILAAEPSYTETTVPKDNKWRFALHLEQAESPDIVLSSTKTFTTEEQAKTALREAGDFMQGFHFIDTMFVLEHILLLLENSAPEQVLPMCPDSQGEKPDPYSFRITLVLPGETERLADTRFRQYLEKSIREATPSHIYPRICCVSNEQIAAFEKSYGQWRTAYLKFTRVSASAYDSDEACAVLDEARAVLDEARAGLIEIAKDLESIYEQARLGGPSSGIGDGTTALVLGHTKLGTQDGD